MNLVKKNKRFRDFYKIQNRLIPNITTLQQHKKTYNAFCNKINIVYNVI